MRLQNRIVVGLFLFASAVSAQIGQGTWELVPGEEILEYVCAENNRYRDLVGR